MNHEVEAVKRLITIGSLLNTSKNKIKCPLPGHVDKHPSCDVDHEAGFWHCKVCDEGGDIFSLLMKRDRMTFPEALTQLAEMAGVKLGKKSDEAQAEWEQTQRIYKALAYAAEYYQSTLMDSVGGLAWLQNRGFTLKTIQDLKIGLSDGNLVRSVKRANLEPLGITVDDFVKAGLMMPGVVQADTHRDFFRDRIMFPLIVRGRVLNMSGRSLTEAKPKYLHLGNLPTEHFYNEDAIGENVWLFEGHPDTLTGVQVGLPAVGVIGTGGMTRPEKLKHAKNIYICGDADTAGQKATDKWATEILKHNPNVNIQFVTLTGQSKDFNEWYVANQKDFSTKFDVLMESAKGLIEYKISKLKSSEDLILVWPFLQNLPEITREGYYQKIKLQLKGCSISLLRRSYKEWAAQRLAENPTQLSTIEGDSFRKGAGPVPANNGYDLEKLTGHVCLFADVHRNVDGKTQSTYEPVAIQSTVDPETGTYQAQTVYLSEQPERFNPSSIPLPYVVSGRWSPEGIAAFRQGREGENTAELLKDLTAYFSRYIWHRDPVTHEILALYTMGTYVARLFQAFPYLSLNGLAGSGKTNTLELLEQLCFNAIMAANVSLPAMFRMIEKCFSTYIRDEAEQFNKKTPENQDELLVLNSGYKAGGMVSRVEKGKNGEMDIQYFNVYSPKIFAGINMLNDTLNTRSILITMHKAPGAEVKKLVSMARFPEQWKGQAGALRDRLYRWALTKFHLVSQAYQEFPAQEKITNRDWEVWAPLLAIAILADNENTQEQLESFSLRTLKFAEKKVKEKREQAKENHLQLKVLDTILLLMDEFEINPLYGHPNWYPLNSTAKKISERLVEDGYFKETKELTPRWLMQILDQAQVITNRDEQVSLIDEGNKKKKCILMTKETVKTALETL